MNLANKITLSRVLMIPVFMVLMAFEAPYGTFVAAAVFGLAAVTDIVDGHIARKSGEVTSFGKFIDPVADKLLVCIALLMLIEKQYITALPAALIIAREFIISGLRLVLVLENGEVLAAGWLGKLKTVAQDVAVLLLILRNWPFEALGIPMDTIVLWLAVALTIASGVHYVWQNRAVFAKEK